VLPLILVSDLSIVTWAKRNQICLIDAFVQYLFITYLNKEQKKLIP